MLSNNPPPAADLFAEEIDNLKSRAEAFGDVTEANAGEARDLIGLAKALAKAIDAKRDEEKRPHLEAGREIDGTYKPLVDSAKYACAPLEKALTDHIVAQKRKAEEARRAAEAKAAAEAAKAKALAEDALLGEDAAADAKAAENEAKLVAAEEKQAGTVKGSEGFRAAGLRTVRKAKVTNRALLIAHYANHPDVWELTTRLANAEIRAAKGAPVSIPGVEVEETEVLV